MPDTFSDLYKKGEKPFGQEPPEYFHEALTYIKQGSALDLGGGYGRFSLYLAQLGLKVTNVDISADGINKFSNKIKELQLNATGIVKDITEFVFEKSYDNILCTTTLHLLGKEKALQLLDKIKHYTVLNGINFISGFVKEHNGLFEKKVPSNNDFLTSYLNWEILYYKKCIVTNINKERIQYFVLVAKKWPK
jgi:2-polyprenyl-3-methyl-5-hydroxy-6-metoxy-1,4-benzoquinol methylase